MKLSEIMNKFKILALATAVMLMLTVSVSASADVLSLYKNKETDNVRFEAKDMLPGDNYQNEGMEHLKHNYCVRVSYNGTITVLFGVENIRTDSATNPLTDVLMCDVKINGELVHSCLLAELKDQDIPYTITGVNTTEDLNYEIGVYLDTSVGNKYQAKKLTADFVWEVELDDDDDDGGSGDGGETPGGDGPGGGGTTPPGGGDGPGGGESPDTPTDPDNPDNPDTPDTPDDPDAPDNPDIPGTPDDPDSPDVPGGTGTPGTPGSGTGTPGEGTDYPGTPGADPDTPGSSDAGAGTTDGKKPTGELIKPPNTGDFKHPLIYITGICVAAFILFILIFVRKKTKNESNRTIRRLMIALAVVVILAICLCVTTFALIYSISVDQNIFSTGTVKINLNNGDPIIEPDEFLFEPGMTVRKEFFIENESTDSVYYKIYFENIDGGLADVLDVTISDKDDGTVFYFGKARNLTFDNTELKSDELGIGKRKELYATFHFPEKSGNDMQNAFLQFDMYATATQKRNNLAREVYREF